MAALSEAESGPPFSPNAITTVIVGDNEQTSLDKCMHMCQGGVTLRRVKNGRLGPPITVRLDEQWLGYHSRGCWTFMPQKLKSVKVENIVEVRKGFNTDNLLEAGKNYAFREKATPEMCFSLVLGRGHISRNKSLDFVASSGEQRDCIAAALQHLIERNALHRVQFDEQRWLREQFRRADTNNSGKLNFAEVWKLLNKLNLGFSEEYARALFKDVDSVVDGELDEKEFTELFGRLSERTDLLYVLRMFSSTNEPVLSPADLEQFLVSEQQFSEVDEKKAKSIIGAFESEKEERECLGPLGFRRLLLERWGRILKLGHESVFQDMNHSLSDYFMSTSHNTYLTGLQMQGEASVEGYINALRCGARLLELDVFDGDDGEPCITHKRTLIKAITLQNSLKAIDEYAFKSSPYPVILTIENHVSMAQQKAMARIFNDVLGDKIYLRPDDAASKPLPSPNALKNMYLLRGKKMRAKLGSDQQFDEENDENNEVQSSKKAKETIALHPDFSALISLPSVKLSHNLYEDIEFHPMDGSASLSESKVTDYFDGGFLLAAYTSKRFVKSYPKGLRQDSSNMNPISSWICGIQSVAMNMQTAGEYMDLVKGLFAVNGNCGYVLKPDVLIRGIDPRSPEVSGNIVMTLAVGIISAQYLPKTRSKNDVIDPYVTVEVFGIPADCQKFKTKTIHNNGFNPQFNETFTFPLRFPPFALLRFCVKDFDSTSANDFIGEFTLPVSSIRAGYSHVRLNTGSDHTPDECASLLVRIALD